MVHEVSTARVPASRVLLVAAFGAFLAFLDATIVNVAFPSIRESFPDTSIGGLSWVLNAYNIVFAAFLIVCGRLTDLLGRRRAFVAGRGASSPSRRPCARPRRPSSCWWPRASCRPSAPRCWCRRRSPWWSRPSPRSGAPTPSGCGAPRPPSPPASDHRSAVRWSSSAAGAGRSWSTCPSGGRGLGGAQPAGREPRARGAVAARPARRGLLAAGLGALNLGIVKGSDWGWASAGVVGAFAATAVLLGLFVAELPARTVRRSWIPRCCASRPSPSRACATGVAGFGFYAYLLTNILWLQYVWGYDVLRAGLALVPGALVAAVVAARLGPLADRSATATSSSPARSSGRAPTSGTTSRSGSSRRSGREWLPGQVLSGIGVGATLPLLGSAALAAVPGGRYATASAVVSSARQLGGVLGIAILVVILGEPTPATAVAVFHDGWMLSIVAFLVVAVVALPLGKLTPLGRRGRRRGRAGAGRPSRSAGRRGGGDSRRPADSTDLSGVPCWPALPADARRRLEAAAELVVGAGRDVADPGGRSRPGPAYVVRRGRLRSGSGAAWCASSGPARCSGSWRCSPGSSGPPTSGPAATRRCSRCRATAFEDMLARRTRPRPDRC